MIHRLPLPNLREHTTQKVSIARLMRVLAQHQGLIVSASRSESVRETGTPTSRYASDPRHPRNGSGSGPIGAYAQEVVG
jgi:hypothetical protein